MADITEAKKAKLIIGIMYSDEQTLNKVLQELRQKFGEYEQGPIINFNFTNYYEQEMGKDLKKTFIAFKQTIKRNELPAIKQTTNKIEQEYSKEGKRTINIDPGYITEQQVVLASTKEHPYRIYLNDGIYAQLIFVYTKKGWAAVEKTFKDYQEKEVQEFLIDTRKSLNSSSKSL